MNKTQTTLSTIARFGLRSVFLIVFLISSLLAGVPRASAGGAVFTHEYPILSVSNQQNCNPQAAQNCWSSNVSGATGGMVFFNIYVRNGGDTPANNTIIRLSPQTSQGTNGSNTFSATVSSSSAASTSGQASVSLTSTQKVSALLNVARLYSDPNATLEHEYGNVSDLFGAGLNIGTVNPGVHKELVVAYSVDANTVPPRSYQCSDGIDNDGNGLIDYPADPGCSGLTDDSESGYFPPVNKPQCSDGIDNDGDGLIDLADPACKGDPNGVTEFPYNYPQNNYSNVIAQTNNASAVMPHSAYLNGLVTISNSGSNQTGQARSWFQYGTNSNNLNMTTNFVTNSSTQQVGEQISNLQPNTTYYFRLLAQNTQTSTTSTGVTLSFMTLADQQVSQAPVAITTMATGITTNSARLNGLVLTQNNSNSTMIWFEYGPTQNLGFSTQTQNVNNLPSVSATDTLTGLVQNQTYYFRVVAQNSGGIARGSILSFNTIKGVVTPVQPQVIIRQVVSSGGGSPLLELVITPRFPQARPGDMVDYTVHWKNISKKTLRKTTLRVQLPQGVIYRQSSAGIYSPLDTILTLPIGDLLPEAEGTIYVGGSMSPNIKNGDLLVATAIVVYEVSPNVPDQAVAYGMISVQDNMSAFGATAIFGGGFFPTTLFGWLILVLIILLLIWIGRTISRRNKVVQTTTTTFTPSNQL